MSVIVRGKKQLKGWQGEHWEIIFQFILKVADSGNRAGICSHWEGDAEVKLCNRTYRLNIEDGVLLYSKIYLLNIFVQFVI